MRTDKNIEKKTIEPEDWKKDFYMMFVRFNSSTGESIGLNQGVQPHQIVAFIDTLIQSEKKKWKAEMMKVIPNSYIVGMASTKPEDLGTPKADPDSEYNKGYRDGQNQLRQQLREKVRGI